MSNLVEVKVPDIGDFNEVEVIEVLVAVGDMVKEEQSLITVESDKASMEIPSTASGRVKSVKVIVGDKVKEGSLVLELEATGAAAATPSAPAATSAPITSAVSQPAVTAAAPVATEAASGPVTVTVPDIGDFAEVEVIEVLVSEGDTVKAEQSLITVESDKASMEIPSSHDGVVTSVKVKVGDKVAKSSAIIELMAKAAGAPPAQAAAMSAVPAASVSTPAAAPTAAETVASSTPAVAETASGRPSPTEAYVEDKPLNKLPHAAPSVRKFARELGVDLNKVQGTGPKARILVDDVRAFVKQALAAAPVGSAAAAGTSGGFSVIDWPKVDFTKFGPIETRPLSRIKKLSGANLSRNWVMIPHVTNNDLADITDLEALRVQLNKENEKQGVKVTMLAFLIKACVAALKKFPEFNASLEGDNLILKQYYHIGFAADTPNGLVVPVIRDADKKGIVELAIESADLAKQARDGKLSPAQMQGGCFTISSLGGIGGTSFTPIINAPEVAILGVTRSSHQPVWDGKAFQPRLMLPLSLSYDHRVIDGAAAARFNAYLGSLLADFRRIAL